MNLYLVLKLLATPTLIGSLLSISFITEGAFATNTKEAIASTQVSCDVPSQGEQTLSSLGHQQRIIVASSNLSGETLELDFSEAESDAAVTLFGCDCPACINALKQLQSQSLLDNVGVKGHCWASLQRQVSPQTVKKVLQELETKEAK